VNREWTTESTKNEKKGHQGTGRRTMEAVEVEECEVVVRCVQSDGKEGKRSRERRI